MKRIWALLASILFVASAGNGLAQASDVIVNGSFETGDYTGWTLLEGDAPKWGTWGIVKDGQEVNLSDELFDYCDNVWVGQNSTGLPRAFETLDGDFLAIQLQNGTQEHRMFQDVTLPENAKALGWRMFYDNMASTFADNQFLAIHIRDLEDNILETLFLTDENEPLKISMSTFGCDISQFAGQSVRIDVQMKVYANFLDAGFDNFNIVLEVEEESETPAYPPGWSASKGKSFSWWEKHEAKTIPIGFSKGKKKGWTK